MSHSHRRESGVWNQRITCGALAQCAQLSLGHTRVVSVGFASLQLWLTTVGSEHEPPDWATDALDAVGFNRSPFAVLTSCEERKR